MSFGFGGGGFGGGGGGFGGGGGGGGTKNVPCRYWQAGNCTKGKNCTFSHDGPRGGGGGGGGRGGSGKKGRNNSKEPDPLILNACPFPIKSYEDKQWYCQQKYIFLFCLLLPLTPSEAKTIADLNPGPPWPFTSYAQKEGGPNDITVFLFSFHSFSSNP